MKNKKILRIVFKSIAETMQMMLDLPKTGIGYIQPKDVLIFESVNGFRNFMTLHKLELLSMIATKKPKSIYELAQMVGRSIAPVQKDCNSLEQSHFIIYKKQIGGRGTLTPKLKFNYNTIHVELPKYPYELMFRAA